MVYNVALDLSHDRYAKRLSQKGTAMAKKGGKGKKKAETVFLVCQETGDYNYVLRRKPGGEKLKLMKYSPRLRKHTLHNEKKK
jgi:large subunit ribosomal protein L33